MLVLVFAAALRGFPRGTGGLADAKREERTIEAEESRKAVPEA